MSSLPQTTSSPVLSHVGIYVMDIEAMTDFYKQVFGMRLTDQGVGRTFKMKLHFLSSSPSQHHQLVLAEGRKADSPSTVNQLSFKVGTLDALRAVRDAAMAHGASGMRGLNHGNALSIYFSDIESNVVEVYLDTPWYIPQPHGDPLDLDRPDADIWMETERICRADPGFMPVEEWMRMTFQAGAAQQR